jgi:hypothetical protein
MKFDGLCAVRQGQFAESTEPIEPVDDGQKMIAGQLADLAGETDRAIGDQDLGLADPAGVEDDLARRRIARCIPGANAELEAAARDTAAGPRNGRRSSARQCARSAQ